MIGNFNHAGPQIAPSSLVDGPSGVCHTADIDSSLGRFLQADTVVPGGDGVSWDRYAFSRNNPVKYVDPDGHFAFVPFLIAAGLLTLKAVDYGWTAYDIYQSGKVLNDPSASPQEKEAAAATIATAIAFEAAEPDDALPGGLPIDDIARKITREPGDELATVVNNAVRGFPTPPTVVKSEIRSPNPVRPSIATDLWDEFLGNGPYNNKNPITGLPDANRIFSTDGTRSIRYGSHEIKYNHYHEEIWSYDSNTNIWYLDNSYRYLQGR